MSEGLRDASILPSFPSRRTLERFLFGMAEAVRVRMGAVVGFGELGYIKTTRAREKKRRSIQHKIQTIEPTHIHTHYFIKMCFGSKSKYHQANSMAEKNAYARPVNAGYYGKQYQYVLSFLSLFPLRAFTDRTNRAPPTNYGRSSHKKSKTGYHHSSSGGGGGFFGGFGGDGG